MDDQNVKFSHFANSWISVYNGLIAYSNTTDYRIRFYNDRFIQVDSVFSSEFDRNKNFLSKRKFDDFSKDEVYALKQFADSNLTRIEKVFLIDSLTLLVTKKLPMSNLSEFDLWRKNDGVWRILRSERTGRFYENGQSYNAENPPCFELYGNMTGISIIDRDFYFVYFPFLPWFSCNRFNMKKDYDEKINAAARKVELYYGISKFKIPFLSK
jgi:hypothetical protein